MSEDFDKTAEGVTDEHAFNMGLMEGSELFKNGDVAAEDSAYVAFGDESVSNGEKTAGDALSVNEDKLRDESVTDCAQREERSRRTGTGAGSDEGRIFTVPNMLSLVRLVIAPFIFYAYVVLKKYNLAAILVVASGLTDAADGFIARNFGQTSNLGKVLDPIADKVTQFVMFFCLITRYRLMRILTVVLVVKEVVQALVVWLAYKKERVVHSSKWFGKLNTIFLYSVCVLLMVLPDIDPNVADVMMYASLVMLAVAFFGYLFQSMKLIMKK